MTWSHGFRAAMPLTLGIAPFALAFGLAAREAGLSPVAIGLMSVLVFAGSAQFLAVGMLLAGASTGQIVLATLFLNSRHLLMATALLPRLAETPRWTRALAAYGITDEAFAVVIREPGAGAAYLIGAETATAAAWIGGSIAGALFGAGLPPTMAEAAGFSLIGFFVAVVATSTRGLAGWLAAGAGGLLALALGGLVPRGWELLLGGAAAATLATIVAARADRSAP